MTGAYSLPTGSPESIVQTNNVQTKTDKPKAPRAENDSAQKEQKHATPETESAQKESQAAAPETESAQKELQAATPENDSAQKDFQTEAKEADFGEKSSAMPQSMQQLLKTLAARYGTDDPVALCDVLSKEERGLSAALEEEEMTAQEVERREKTKEAALLARRERMKQETGLRATSLLSQWEEQHRDAVARYPEINLQREVKNPAFCRLLRAGIPVGDAYATLHREELMQTAVQSAEKAVIDRIRARGMRPQENGARADAGVLIRNDVSRLSRGDRAEAVRRAMKGDKVTF